MPSIPMKAGFAAAAVILVAVGVGAMIGVGSYTFVYAQGGSYLSENPESCANCHVMQDHYDAWLKSSHRHVATCNDCHTPHDKLGKYLAKGVNGFNHSLAFTTGRFHEPIQINEWNRNITESACRSCHADIVRGIDRFHRPGEALSCLRCHGDVGHPR